MKEIELVNGKGYALVDDDDYEELSQYKWYALSSDRYTTYAWRKSRRDDGRITVRMHRQIMDAPAGKQVDHINHDGLDNRRENLRLCSPSQNMRNSRKRKGTSSRYKGVYWQKDRSAWRAQAYLNGKLIYLGTFRDEDDAARAYNDWLAENAPRFGTFNDV